MAKEPARKQKDDALAKKLNRSVLFMHIAIASLIALILRVIIVGTGVIATVEWVLLKIFIAFLVLGLVCGVDYLNNALPMQETVETSGDA